MEDKLVTLAIHTFEKAQILKTILETEGIEVYIHNVNQIQPVVSAGVRVRIKESDLPHALRIIEDNKWFEEPKEEEAKVNAVKKVLIPIDFSDYSAKACELKVRFRSRTRRWTPWCQLSPPSNRCQSRLASWFHSRPWANSFPMNSSFLPGNAHIQP